MFPSFKFWPDFELCTNFRPLCKVAGSDKRAQLFHFAQTFANTSKPEGTNFYLSLGHFLYNFVNKNTESHSFHFLQTNLCYADLISHFSTRIFLLQFWIDFTSPKSIDENVAIDIVAGSNPTFKWNLNIKQHDQDQKHVISSWLAILEQRRFLPSPYQVGIYLSIELLLTEEWRLVKSNLFQYNF